MALDIQVTDARLPQQPEAGGVVTGIPDLDQLHEPTLDGAADENTRANCVFTSNADISRYDRPDLNADGDAIKDSIPAYGQGYTGFASQDVVIESGVLEEKWGTHSYRVNGPAGGGQSARLALLSDLTLLANNGVPSIVTIPSMWGSQPSAPNYDPDHPNFYCHACVYAGQLADGQHVLCNPWGGFLMYYSSDDLALRLCFLCAYPVAKHAEAVTPMAIVLDKNTSGVLVGAHDADNAAITVGAGMAQTLADKGWLGAEITVPETRLGSGETIAVVRGAAKAALTYTPAEGVLVYGGTIAAAVQDLYSLWQTLLHAPAPPTPVNVHAQIAALVAALGSQAA